MSRKLTHGSFFLSIKSKIFPKILLKINVICKTILLKLVASSFLMIVIFDVSDGQKSLSCCQNKGHGTFCPYKKKGELFSSVNLNRSIIGLLMRRHGTKNQSSSV